MNTKQFPVNTKGRDFVVGDLHGQLPLLLQAMQHVNFSKQTDRMFSVGDLVDRGPDSLGCLKLLDEPWFHAVKGNHEDLMVHALHPTGDRNMGSWWGPNGGNWNKLEDPLEALVEKANNLPLLITVELANNTRFHVIHAELHSHVDITDEDLADPVELDAILRHEGVDGLSVIWGRQLFRDFFAQPLDDSSLARFRKYVPGRNRHPDLSPVFSGHTIVRNPLKVGPFIDIDTGAFLTGSREWAGLTLAEPLTNKFWKTNQTETQQVELIVL